MYDQAQANVAFSVLVQAASAIVTVDAAEVLRWTKEIRNDDLQSEDPAVRSTAERILRFIETMRGVQEQLRSTPIPRFRRTETVQDKPATRSPPA